MFKNRKKFKAEFVEGSDAPFSTSTPYSIAAGDTFEGTLSTRSDSDAIAFEVEAGVTYTISLDSFGADGVPDTYLYIFDSEGQAIAMDDDSGEGLNSLVTFTATSSGKFYIGATGVGRDTTGDYKITLTSNAGPVDPDDPVDPDEPVDPNAFTNDQIAAQLTDGFWESNHDSRRSFDVSPGEAITVDIGDLNADGRELAIKALQAWTMTTGINFEFVTSNAQITFDDNESGAYSTSSTSGGTIRSSFVNVSTDWVASYGTDLDGYAFQTYMHEIGHAMGLGHAGNYNGSADYGVDNHYSNDSWQASVMSYFDQRDNTSVDASFAYVVSPMIADILAMQELYGTTADLRTESTVYGENSTAGGYYDEIADLRPVAFTVIDNGGIDSINFSSVTADQKISLIAETYSDVDGLTGNMAIMRGTVIENAYSGSGDDQLIGNSADNALYANAGDDVLEGGQGDDTLSGGTGSDTFVFNINCDADTIIDFSDGLDFMMFESGASNFADLTVQDTGADTVVSYDGGSITLTGIESSLISADDFMFA
ncbi:Serralysin C precursor [Pseudovibrio axinellae]|uniref:Serralysin C n=1 Tax=Pseudovibrio axinellae TaxID=989403 RepID=A0A165ZFF5_9HYPH|nr:M10 family metallopeptidase C-terminal domain-containing protein [Pseudovibrio axinellae]KZL19834.1 Serralysin C precursor [Pseudovibrio axinellae]SER39695.1 serralysin [Pseudovibrio axinellae]